MTIPPTGAATPPSRVAIDVAADTLYTLGVQIEPVRREALAQTVQAVATVALDESRISHAHTRVAGWVEQLDVNTTGELVRAGQPLARVFSQELLSSQTEYLAARRALAASGISSAVVASGRTRLTVLGMTAQEIAAIEESGEPRRLVTIVAPRSGVVVVRGVAREELAERDPERASGLLDEPAGAAEVVGVVVRDDHAPHRAALERVDEMALPEVPRHLRAVARVDDGPAVAVLEQPQIDVVEREGQRHADPAHAGRHGDRLARCGDALAVGIGYFVVKTQSPFHAGPGVAARKC